MRLNGNMATEVAKEAFLTALKYGASSPTRCELLFTKSALTFNLDLGEQERLWERRYRGYCCCALPCFS
jgi:hypothetical protein